MKIEDLYYLKNGAEKIWKIGGNVKVLMECWSIGVVKYWSDKCLKSFYKKYQRLVTSLVPLLQHSITPVFSLEPLYPSPNFR